MAVEQNGSMFMRKEIYLDEIYTKDGHIHVGLTNFGLGPNVAYRLSSAERTEDGQITARRSYFSTFTVANPNTIWTLEIEGCLAYRGRIPSASGVV